MPVTTGSVRARDATVPSGRARWRAGRLSSTPQQSVGLFNTRISVSPTTIRSAFPAPLVSSPRPSPKRPAARQRDRTGAHPQRCAGSADGRRLWPRGAAGRSPTGAGPAPRPRPGTASSPAPSSAPRQAARSGVAEREELTETGLGSTARCCGRRRHRQANSVRVCSPTSRRVASLRPRSAGLTALTPAPRTARPDWLLPTMLTHTPPTCCGRRPVQNDALSGDR